MNGNEGFFGFIEGTQGGGTRSWGHTDSWGGPPSFVPIHAASKIQYIVGNTRFYLTHFPNNVKISLWTKQLNIY